MLDRLESAEGRYELIELAESIRLDEQVQFHNLHHGTTPQLEGAASRYLDLVKGAVLDEHYLENEVRIQHLMACYRGREETSAARALRDPGRYLAGGRCAGSRRRARAGELPTRLRQRGSAERCSR